MFGINGMEWDCWAGSGVGSFVCLFVCLFVFFPPIFCFVRCVVGAWFFGRVFCVVGACVWGVFGVGGVDRICILFWV